MPSSCLASVSSGCAPTAKADRSQQKPAVDLLPKHDDLDNQSGECGRSLFVVGLVDANSSNNNS
jgi:hypothetical protein